MIGSDEHNDQNNSSVFRNPSGKGARKMKIDPVPIRLAGVNIVIHPLGNAMAKRCRNYIHAGEPDFHVHMDQAVRDMSKHYIGNERDPAKIPPGISTHLAVYRAIVEQMPAYNTFLMHAVALSVDGKGYLFAAPSKTGKTTHTQLWAERFGERLTIINDDKPLVKIEDDRITIHGTPWCGKENRNTNTSAPLHGIICLHRSKQNQIAPAPSPEHAWDFLMHQTYRSRDPQVMRQILRLLGTLIAHVPIYDLYCNMEPDAVTVACDTLDPSLIMKRRTP